ncbi:MAG: flagellar export protein FliJ, partial [Thalassolituus sp.]
GDIEQRLSAERDKRKQLQGYAQDYRQQITAPTGQAVSAGHIHNSLEFISQIESALTQQDTQLAQLQAQSDKARQAYLVIHNKVDAMEKMIERLEQDFQSDLSRREQREADEWANRRR